VYLAVSWELIAGDKPVSRICLSSMITNCFWELSFAFNLVRDPYI